MKSTLPTIENLTPLIQAEKAKLNQNNAPKNSMKKSDILKQFAKKERPSSAGSTSNDPAKIKEMLKYLKNKSGTSEKKSVDPPSSL